MKAREHCGFDYLGDEDNNRISSEPLLEEEIFEQVRKIMNGVEEKPSTPGELSASTRPPQVCIESSKKQLRPYYIFLYIYHPATFHL